MILAEFAMYPIGVGESLSPWVARAVEVVDRSGLPYRLTPMGTVVEGEWDEVMAVIRACWQALDADCDRISVSIRVDARKGPGGRLDSKIASVAARIGRPVQR
ncbi:MAG: MTH1187 family thiamine-binding protein [Deltaproteobacteria bacterium]|nr:MTH1187 family thiamine-binding protein [Deltaproteobacteria bacterium]